MSFKTFEMDVEKFFSNTGTSLEKFGAAFSKIFKKAPSVIQTVENFVDEAAPIIEGAVALADPVLEPEVAAGLAIAEKGLAAIQAAAANANSGQSLLQNLQNFAASVPSVLTGIQVKNPALQQKVTGIVNFVVNEVKVLTPAVEALVQKFKPLPIPVTGGPTKPVVPVPPLVHS